jgi:alpha-mannosidase
LKGGPVDNKALIVELGPMEIRTFLLKFWITNLQLLSL